MRKTDEERHGRELGIPGRITTGAIIVFLRGETQKRAGDSRPYHNRCYHRVPTRRDAEESWGFQAVSQQVLSSCSYEERRRRELGIPGRVTTGAIIVFLRGETQKRAGDSRPSHNRCYHRVPTRRDAEESWRFQAESQQVLSSCSYEERHGRELGIPGRVTTGAIIVFLRGETQKRAGDSRPNHNRCYHRVPTHEMSCGAGKQQCLNVFECSQCVFVIK